ncbi:ferric iron reductase protein FhuF [Ensifer sp. WSM1721]|uniref:siderophore-iron reductase FhuF n=1 Tax=Ensifer sp. WSM1721 TaxID=1041159 RepID=UPI0004BB520D|nr:siderophore-iron reductase FhuF [Ensifer sp. WSM1721]
MTTAGRESMVHVGGPTPLSAAFAGPHAWCNEKMVLSADLADGIPLPEFFASGAFDRALSLYAETSGGSDRRAVASMWSLFYFSALTIPYVVARVLDHQALPVMFEDMTVALSADGLPRAFGVATAGEWRDGAGEIFAVIGSLMEEHLSRVVPYLKATGGISPKLAWNNAAVYIDYALRTAGTEPLNEQADAMVGCRVMPNGAPNPFFDCLRQEEEADGTRVCRRKICCLRYLLPGVPSCGSLCALPSQRNQ